MEISDQLAQEFEEKEMSAADAVYTASVISSQIAAVVLMGSLDDRQITDDNLIKKFINGYIELFTKAAETIRDVRRAEVASGKRVGEDDEAVDQKLREMGLLTTVDDPWE